MAELSSYPAVTTLAGPERIPIVTNPGVPGGNKYITAANLYDDLAADTAFTSVFAPASVPVLVQASVADQTTAMTAAIAALPTTGGRVAIPGGTFYSRFNIANRSGVTFTGAGKFATTIVAPSAAVMVSPTGTRGNITFEDMTVDLNSLSTGFWSVYPDDGLVTFRRVRFINILGFGVNLNGSLNTLFEDCEGDDGGNAVGTFISCDNGVRGLRLVRTGCRYVNHGLIFDTSSHDDIDVDGGRFDGGWYLLRTRSGGYTGSGGTVTYSSGGLVDSAASFGTIPTPFLVNVRALPVLATGAATATYQNTYLNDSAADFVTAAVKPGHIVRVSGKFAVVERVLSATRLHIEEWIDSTTYRPVAPPANTTAYTVYRVLLAIVNSNTSTAITVDRWFDFFDGTTATPASGTLYEVLINHGGYSGIHASALSTHAAGSIRHIRIHGGAHITRIWNDSISVYGSDARLVIDKTVLVDHGQDFGITCHGDQARIDATVTHCGAAGIAVSGANTVVNAFCSGSPYVNTANTIWLGDIIVSGTRTRLTGSMVVASGPLARHGFVIYGAAAVGVVDGVDFAGTTANGYSTAEYRLYADGAAGITNTILRDVVGVLSIVNATGTILGPLESLGIAVGDETTAITTGTAKVTYRMPYAFVLSEVRASLTTASSSGIPTVDVNEGAGAGTSILSTKLTIDASELTSTTAATPAVLSDTLLANDAQITIDIDVAGTGAAGLKVYLIGRRVAT